MRILIAVALGSIRTMTKKPVSLGMHRVFQLSALLFCSPLSFLVIRPLMSDAVGAVRRCCDTARI
jgi:hypothetical protein